MNSNMIVEKNCRKCVKRKPKTEFYSNGKGGLTANCKECCLKHKKTLSLQKKKGDQRELRWKIKECIQLNLECNLNELLESCRSHHDQTTESFILNFRINERKALENLWKTK